MIVIGILIFVLITLLPGLMAVRMLRTNNSQTINTLLYAVGLGLIFNLFVGIVANFTFGIRLIPVAVVYVVSLIILSLFSYRFGKKIFINWRFGWKSKSFLIPISIYLLAVVLQYQTTLISSNLVGSDIHLEYFISNMVLEQGFWNPAYMGTYLNACMGLTILLPVYKLLTNLELIWIFKLICPLVFAVLPVVLYRIFKMQFSTIVSVLAVIFFVTMPMFTMDLVQLVRQQQSELFFILVFLIILDTDMNILCKIIVGLFFSIGVMITHVGIAIGFIGYLLAGLVFVILLTRFWRNKVNQIKKPIWGMLLIVILLFGTIGIYAGFYGFVYSGKMITSVSLPVEIAQRTIEMISTGIEGTNNGVQTVSPSVIYDRPSGLDGIENSGEKLPTQDIPVVKGMSFFQRFPFLNPLAKEPLAQTAIGLDFGKASVLGKIWRVLQYLVEICLIVGLFKLLLRPLRNMRVEYMAFVIGSFFVLVGIYGLSTYGWGLGTVRVLGITLLFMAPLFVIGCGTIGKWVIRIKSISEGRIFLVSTLILLIPYYIFNSGMVFEIAKMKPVGFIDVPYSISMSYHRVDIASVFDKQDVEAMDWMKGQFFKDKQIIYADTHGANLMVQRIGMNVEVGQFKYLWQMSADDKGYIFLRKWNVDNGMLTAYGDYGTRQSYGIDDYSIVEDKIKNGIIIFDNGARVILVK